jgi:folate-binding protein YgfZ
MNDPTASPLLGPPLAHLALLSFSGADAAGFLQGQLTQDLRRLDDGSTRLAALNTPQGRVVATLWLKGDATLFGLLPAELAEPVVARLRRYVLRAKVAIEALPDWSLREIPRGTSQLPVGSVRFGMPDGRALLAVPGAAAAPNEAATRDWLRRDVAAGLPVLGTATSGQFVAQMLNLDRLDAISFAKGCYTGQEIVARTQNLGRIKRRMLRYRVAAPQPPAPLSALLQDGIRVGEVLFGIDSLDGGSELLAVVQLEARDLPLRTETGHTATPLALPYSP